MKAQELRDELEASTYGTNRKRVVVSLYINGQYYCLPVTSVDAENFPDCVLEVAEEVKTS